jgi:anti-sigma factor RsiW
MTACADIERLLHPYVDGELVAEDNDVVERHAAGCERCRALLSFHAGFKAQVRARLRARPGAPVEEPARLRGAVLAALDRADAAGEGPVRRPWVRLAPAFAAVFVAAAATALFIGIGSSRAESPIVAEAIRGHEKNLPVEVGGADAEVVRSWMQGKVPVPVRPPQLRSPTASLVGGRVYHLRNRDVGQLVYRVRDSQVTVYVFDPSGWELSGPTRQTVGRHEVFLSEKRGYTVAMYRDRGVGYAFASDLARDEVLRLVAASLGERSP